MSGSQAELPNTADKEFGVGAEITLRSDPVPDDTILIPETYWLAHDIVVQDTELDGYFRRALQSRLTRHGDAEDARQDALLGLMSTYGQDRPDLDINNGAKGLIRGIGRNKVMDQLRRAARDRSQLVDIPDGSDGPSFEDGIDFWLSDAPKLRRVIQQLPERYQQIIGVTLSKPGLSGEELGKMLGVKPIAARTARHRAFSALRTKLDEVEEGTGTSGLPSPVPGAKISLDDLRRKAAKELQKARKKDEQEVSVVVPEYLGPLLVAAQDMNWYFRRATRAGRALVVYPHAELRGMVINHMDSRGGRGSRGRVDVMLPENVTALPAKSSYKYIVGVGELDQEVVARLRDASSFFLRLHTHFSRTPDTQTLPGQAAEAVQRPLDLHKAAWHGRRVRSRLDWTPDDSVNYLREYWLMYGRQMMFGEAQMRADRGVGPSVQQLCREIGSFAALQAKAGYDIG